MRALVSMGNPIKSDDNIGNIVLDLISFDGIKIRAETTLENFIDKMKGCNQIIIVDALEFDGKVGEVREFILEDVEDRLLSTHSMPIEMLRKFLPKAKIRVIGIKPKDLDFGSELSEELEAKKEEITRNIEKLL